MAIKGLGIRKISSRHKRRPTCMQPKQPQPPSHLVAVLHGEVPRFLVVEVAVEVKVDLASKAFNKEKDPKSERENILSTASPKRFVSKLIPQIV